MSDTKNVKLGTCRIYYAGVDLGYTQGGVEVTVKTDTHPVNVDQFGKSTINEIIMGRNVMVKCPLAETTVENLVRIMPGAVLNEIGGIQATGTLTVGASMPVVGDKLIVGPNAATFSFVSAAPVLPGQILIAATASAQAANIVTALGAYDGPGVKSVLASATAGVVTLTYYRYGSVGNAYPISFTGSAAVTVSGATLAGGVDGRANVVTPTGVGVSLLQIAQELRLHPKELDASDTSQDFIVPLASTAGDIKFMYKLDQERLFDCVFTGYPDPVSDTLFIVGSRV